MGNVTLVVLERCRMKFFIKCVPPKTTAQATTRVFRNKYTGKMFIGKDKRGQSVREELMGLLRPYIPEKPFTNAVELKVKWQYPFRKSETKKNIAKGMIWCTTKPDCDNLNKLLADCITRLGFWTDDSLVAVLHFEKFYCSNSGIEVEINEI